MAASASSVTEAAEATRPSPASRVVFDFVANRVLAHRFVATEAGDTWIAEARAGHFDKLIGFDSGGWRLDHLGELSVARLTSREGAIRVPERARAGSPNRLRLLVSSPRDARVKVSSADQTLATIDLVKGWQDLEVPLAGAVAGELVFSSASRGIALVTLALGRGEIAPLGVLADESVAFLNLARGESLSYYVSNVAGARLVGRAARADGASGCQVWASVVSADGVSEAAPVPQTIEARGDVIRVDVSLRECAGGTLEVLSMEAPIGELRPPAAGPPAKNVILWVMDTLRADRLRPFNPAARAEVPALERLASRGVVFRRAWSAGNESKASHASLWTSVYPAVHEIRTAGRAGEWQLKRSLLTLGELMRGAGKRAVGLTANGMVTRNAGYARGFSRFENPMRDGTGKRRNGWIPAERLWRRATQLLDPMAGEPFFFFFGTIDTHKPWVGHQPWLDRYDTDYRGPFTKAAYPGQLGIKAGSMQCTVVPKPRDLERINAIYDSAISYQDAHLGLLLDWLEERGILDDTLIVLTADHGEELWEVGRCGHGASLRETLLNVPLLVSYPSRLPSGLVIEDGVDGVDVLPTILDLIDVERHAALQGTSLVETVLAGGAGYPRASYASQYEYAHAMRIGDWKLRVGKGTELYDLGADPDEKTNLAGGSSLAEQQIGDALSLFLHHRKRWRKTTWGVANNLTREGALALENQ